MRELKLRVWDSEKMLYPRAPRYIAIGGCSWGFWDEEKLLAGNHNPNHKLMQYTNYADRNLVEIYENDIVDIIFPKKLFNRGIVCFEKGSWMIKWDYGRKGGRLSFLGEVHENIEKSGNIYENPELLEMS
jgi:hypothetical protein